MSLILLKYLKVDILVLLSSFNHTCNQGRFVSKNVLFISNERRIKRHGELATCIKILVLKLMLPW